VELSKVKHQRILISPLDWGMGHVSRCIALIRLLHQQQNTVLIACDALQKAAFQSYFPDIQYLDHAGYGLQFGGKGNWRSDLLKNLFPWLKKMHAESRQVEKWVKLHEIDLVISDHRYGFRTKSVPSVIVIHQLHLPLKKHEWIAQRRHLSFLRKFDALWVPDDVQQNLSGRLGVPLAGFQIDYIGPLSRFIKQSATKLTCDFLYVISGPAPYAEQFFCELLAFIPSGARVTCICPAVYALPNDLPENVQVIVSQDWKAIDRLFHASGCIVSRAGYSTLMDLKILDKKAILIPTPGQPEQLYLAEKHRNSADWEFRTQWHENQQFN
jgi:uncharacterized protein (TIGR00661 family)